MPRGNKNCPSCSAANGPRAYQCKACGASFAFKKESTTVKAEKVIKAKKRSNKILLQVDWKNLSIGDHILVKGGPYYFIKSKMIKRPMGYKGHYIVKEVQDNGILAYSGKKEGYAFIYMGKPSVSPDGIIQRRPHKLRLLKRDK